MAKSITFFASLIILLSLTACQQSRDLSEMHDNTKEMDGSTKEMKDSLGEMRTSMADMLKNTQALSQNMQDLAHATTQSLGETNQHMGSMSATMDKLLRATDGLCQTRHGQSTVTRTDAFKKMLEMKTPEEKVARATEYLMAFEYQLWGLCDDDTLEYRDTLMDTAVQEFLLDLGEIKGSKAAPSAMASLHPADKDADRAADMNFNAVAVALHGIDDVQKALIARYNHEHSPALQPKSMYSILVEALKVGDNADKAWQHSVLKKPRLALRVLQARHNFAVAVVIGELVNRATHGVLANISLLLNKTVGGGFPVSVNVDEFTSDELTDLSNDLMLALETRQALKQLNIPAQMDQELAPFVAGAQLKSSGKGAPALIAKREQFNRLLNSVKKP